MSEETLKALSEKMDAMMGLSKAPSQYQVFLHLLGTGRSMAVKELSGELGLSSKATERAVAKLVEKDLVQRASFRQRSYSCDSREILLAMLLRFSELEDRLSRRGL